MERGWTRKARRLETQVNVGWALALGAPRVGGLALLAAAACLLMRSLGVPVTAVALVIGGLLGLGLAWTGALLWRRRYRLDDAFSRLDADLGLGGALLAAREGVAPWPPLRPAAAGMRWRLRRSAPGLIAAPLVLVAAWWVPIESRARHERRPPEAPLVWRDVQDALQILEEEPLVAPAELDRWQEQLRELGELPPEQWFEDETQEAADALWSRLRSTVARSEQAVEPVERALAEAEAAQSEASREAAQRSLQKALEAAGAEGVSLDPELADRLRTLDPADLPSMSPQALESLQRDLARARAAGAAARKAKPGEGEGEGEGERPGVGGVKRGPGTAPIQLSPEAARRLAERTEGLEGEGDRRRDALSGVTKIDAVAPEVDPDAYRGPAASDGTEHLGRGGQAVWQLRLDPDEQALLQRYFE